MKKIIGLGLAFIFPSNVNAVDIGVSNRRE